MKYILVALLFTLSISGYSYTIKKVPKDAAHPYGGIDVRSHNYRPGMPGFVMLYGIGEKGNGTTDLAKIERLSNHKELCIAADSFDFNFFAVQTPASYLGTEIQYAIDYLINEVGSDPNRIYLLTMSNGGYGYAGAADKYPDLSKLFAAVVQVVMGPGERTNTAKNIAASKRPHWFFVTADDDVTPPTNTLNLYANAKAAGGNVYLTKWYSGKHGVLGRVVSSWGNKKPNNWTVATCKPTDKYGASEVCDPAYNNIYEWCFANVLGGPVYSPTQLKPAPARKPVDTVKVDTIPRVDTVVAPTPAPDPITPKPTLIGISVSPDAKNKNFFCQLFYSDGSNETFRSLTDDIMKNAWINLKADPKITITFQKRKAEYRTKVKP
jgi:dienelactone hydrolase